MIFAHAYGLQRALHPLYDFLARHSEVFRSESDIVLHNGRYHLIVGILKHHSDLLAYFVKLFFHLGIQPVDANLSRLRKQKPVEQLCKSAFAAAVVPDQSKKLSFKYFQTDILHALFLCGGRAVVLIDLVFVGHVFQPDDNLSFFRHFNISAAFLRCFSVYHFSSRLVNKTRQKKKPCALKAARFRAPLFRLCGRFTLRRLYFRQKAKLSPRFPQND